MKTKEECYMSKEVIQYINDNLYGVWYLIGAALVFWMQAGFAMEIGRAHV